MFVKQAITKGASVYRPSTLNQPTILAVSQLRLFSQGPSSTDDKSSQQQQPEFKTTGEMRQALIKASFVHARTAGFNDQCIIDACKDFGYPPITAGVIKRGPMEVVDYAMEFWLKQMSEELKKKELAEMRIRERVFEGIKTRLELEQPYKSVWPQAMKLGALPQNMPGTLKHIHNISDEVWFQAGDKAVDFSWYTKRAIVSKIYVATELYLMQDNSAENEATWEFLDRRIDNVMEVGKVLRGNSNVTQAVQTGLASILSIVKPTQFDDSQMRKQQEELKKREQAAENKEK